jgi:hypothetical protein
MTAIMDSNISSDDILDLAIEADNSSSNLVTSILNLLIHSIHKQALEIEKETLLIDEMNNLPVDDLDEFYDTALDLSDNIKVQRKQVQKHNSTNTLFNELDKQLERLYQANILLMDRMGQLEVRLLTQEKSA